MSLLCSFCNVKDENPYHLFYERSHRISLWNQLRHFLYDFLNIPLSTTQSAISGFINQKENVLIINHLLFIFKFYIYNSRSSSKLNIEFLKTIIYKTRKIELELGKTEAMRNQKYINKWQPIPITFSKKCKRQGGGGEGLIYYYYYYYHYYYYYLFILSFCVCVLLVFFCVKKEHRFADCLSCTQFKDMACV